MKKETSNMFEPFNKLVVSFLLSLDQNASLLFASVIGSLVSVFAREEKSTSAAIASFFSGVFAGWYLSQWIIYYISVPREPLAAVLAIIGRDLVRHIINSGHNNPMFIFDFVDRIRGAASTPTVPPAMQNITPPVTSIPVPKIENDTKTEDEK